MNESERKGTSFIINDCVYEIVRCVQRGRHSGNLHYTVVANMPEWIVIAVRYGQLLHHRPAPINYWQDNDVSYQIHTTHLLHEASAVEWYNVALQRSDHRAVFLLRKLL